MVKYPFGGDQAGSKQGQVRKLTGNKQQSTEQLGRPEWGSNLEVPLKSQKLDQCRPDNKLT